MSLDTSALDAILVNAVKAGAAPGLAVTVVSRDGVLYSGAVGIDPGTIFRYMSLTKALTSVAALQLIESGHLSVEDAVAAHLPEFGKLQVLEGFDGDTPVLRPPSRPVLVRELMNHTSGLSYHFTSAEIAKFLEVTGLPSVDSGEKASLLDVPLTTDPGTVWAYGTSTDWLGLLVEQISGQPLDKYIEEHVSGPLKLADITFHPNEEQQARMMPLFARMPDGTLAEMPTELPPASEFWPGGHGLHGTAEAYGRLIQALLRGGELDGARVLKPETVDLAFTDSLQGVPMPTEGVVSSNPMLTNDIPPYPFAEGWGLGFHLTLEDIPDARRAGTGDWGGLFNLYYFIDRATGVGAILATQVLPFFDWPIVETWMQVEATIYAGLNSSE